MSFFSMSLFLLLIGSSHGPLPITLEPRPAQPWVQQVALTCGRTTYRIEGYGVAYPENQPVRISANRRPMRGEAAERLARDLSRRGAAYRISGVCSGDGIDLLVYRGEVGARGVVAYHVGAAAISPRDGLFHRGLEETDANNFWFR